jgi:hypothetical protein
MRRTLCLHGVLNTTTARRGARYSAVTSRKPAAMARAMVIHSKRRCGTRRSSSRPATAPATTTGSSMASKKSEDDRETGAVWSAATLAGPVHRLASPGGGRLPSGVRSQPLSRWSAETRLEHAVKMRQIAKTAGKSDSNHGMPAPLQERGGMLQPQRSQLGQKTPAGGASEQFGEIVAG